MLKVEKGDKRRKLKKRQEKVLEVKKMKRGRKKE